MSVTYDEKGKPVVKVKTYGDVMLQSFAETLKDSILERKLKG